MKKVISLILILCMVLSVVPAFAEEEPKWNIDENGTLYLTGIGEASVPAIDVEPTEIKKLVVGKSITNLDYVIAALNKNEKSWWVEEIIVDEENEHFSSLNGVLFNKDKTKLIKFPPLKEGEYAIPEGVKELDARAFARSINVTKVVIPDGVTEIKSGTFSQCMKLESITIPQSVKKIEAGAFSGGDTNMIGQHPTALKEIDYKGSYAQWSQIQKGASYNYHRMNITQGGDILKKATKHFTDTYILFGGKRIDLTAPMYASYDRVMVPLEDICTAMGYSVQWDNAAWGVRAIKGNTHILFPIFPDNTSKGEVYDVYCIDGSGESVVTQNSYQLQSLQGGLYYEDIYHHSVLNNGKAMASVKLVEKVFGNSVEYSMTAGVTQSDITNKAQYIRAYDDCTVAVYENAVWAWGETYGEIPVKILENIKELKAVQRSFASYSFYAICEDNSLYVWGTHGSYANMLPSLKPSKYTYVGGMLGLPCNTNVKPQYDGPSNNIDWSKYNDASPDQKTPVKLLDNIKQVITGSGKVVALGLDGEVYIWGQYSGANRNGDYAPKLINSNAKEVYVTGTSPALDNGKIGVWEKDGSFAVYSGSNVQVRLDKVVRVFGTMYIASYTPAFLVLTEEGKVWELQYNKTLIMENVTGFEAIKGVIYLRGADGSVYERAMDGAGFKIQLTDKEIEFEELFERNITVNVNGKPIVTDVVPYIKNDRTLVPMRAIFEALGANVSWDDATKTAIGVKDGAQVKITIGENVLYKNGEATLLDCAAEITNDRTMVPVRAISEAFGADVLWDNDNRAVKITLDKALKVIRIGTHAAYEDDPYSENCTMTEEEKTAAIKALDKVEEALGVRIEFVPYTTSDYRQLIAESIAEGNPFCDLAVLWAGSEKSALDADILQSMDTYADVFEGNYPIKSKADGHYYFMSRNFSFVNTWPIVYNIQLLDNIPSLKEADGTTLYPAEMYYRGEWTFSAFEEYLEKIKAHCDSYTGINAYYAPVPFETNYIYFTCEALHAAGAGIYDGESILAASDSAMSVCEYVKNLFDKGLVSCSSAERHPNDAGWISATGAFLQGKTYFTNCAKWKMNNANNPVGVVPFPKIDGESAGYEHVNFGTDSVGLVKGVDEKTSRLALAAYKMYTEEYCKALADVGAIEDFAKAYAAADAKSFGVDVTHPEIGQYHAEIWAEYAKTPVNEYSEAFGLLYKWGNVFGKCTFGDIGFDNYKEMTESIK